MATIDNLKVSISDMKSDELFDRLRELRQNRRTNKRPKKASSTSKKKEIDLDKMLGKMTPEQRQQLAKELEKQ